MKKYLFMHVGFEKPTPEIMEAWQNWFGSISKAQLDQGGFGAGKEITKSGTNDLSWDKSALTGYNIVEAESMDAAVKLASSCPFISAIRVYELR